jgi:outer membrane protein TolC
MKKALIFIPFLLILVLPLSSQESYSWKDLFENALHRNASLAQKQDAATAAEYQWKSAKRSRGPELSFESDLSYLTRPQEVDLEAGSLYEGGPVAPGVNFPALPETDMTLPLSGNQWYSFRLVLDQPLITSGKLQGQQNIYRALWESSVLDQQQRELVIKAEILTIVHSLNFLQDIIDLIEEQKTSASRFVSLTRNSYDSGMASYSDFLGAQVKAREITLTENQVRRQQNSVFLHLEYLCGIEELTPVNISTADLPPLGNETDSEVLLAVAIQNSPALLMLRQKIEASRQNVKVVQGSSYGRPDLGLRVALDYAGGSIPFTSDEWGYQDANITGTLGIRALLGDSGKAAADVKSARSSLSESEHQYRDNLEQIKRAIGEELFNQNLSRENIDYYKSRAEDDLSMAQQRKEYWQAGYGMEQDYLLQMISWYSDLIYKKQEQISLAVSYYKLKAITGVIEE